jgi:hypothetical protein
VLLQDPDDLLLAEPAALHVLVLTIGQNELQAGLSQWRNVKVGSGKPRRSIQLTDIIRPKN